MTDIIVSSTAGDTDHIAVNDNPMSSTIITESEIVGNSIVPERETFVTVMDAANALTALCDNEEDKATVQPRRADDDINGNEQQSVQQQQQQQLQHHQSVDNPTEDHNEELALSQATTDSSEEAKDGNNNGTTMISGDLPGPTQDMREGDRIKESTHMNGNSTMLSSASNHSMGTTTTSTTKTTTITATTTASVNTESSTTNGASGDSSAKRYIPEHKKPDAALTFPEKMMALMRFVDEHKDDPNYCAAWLPDGKSFIVRQPDEFARLVVPKYFKAAKFSSFTRKLYRWGFRQINRGLGPDDPVIFGNEFFERDNEELMSKMRSITAAGTRKSESRVISIGASNPYQQHQSMYGKRPYDTMNGTPHPMMYDNLAEQQKRYMYEQFMQQQQRNVQHHPQQQQHMMHQPNPSSIYGGVSVAPIPMNHPYHHGPVGGVDYPTSIQQQQYNNNHHQHHQMMQPPTAMNLQQQQQQQDVSSPPMHYMTNGEHNSNNNTMSSYNHPMSQLPPTPLQQHHQHEQHHPHSSPIIPQQLQGGGGGADGEMMVGPFSPNKVFHPSMDSKALI